MTSPLIQRLIDECHFPELNEENLEQFINSHENVMLFLTENFLNFPETTDVAVILPELVTAFKGFDLKAAVISRDIERDLQRQYGFKSWPALLFLRNGEYLGVISKVQDWSDYLREINQILTSEPSEPPQVKFHMDKHKSSQAENDNKQASA